MTTTETSTTPGPHHKGILSRWRHQSPHVVDVGRELNATAADLPPDP